MSKDGAARFTIRPEQIQALGRSDEFFARAAKHLRHHFPEARDLPAAHLRDIVAHGHRRAAAHGFVTEQDVCKFLNLMFTFGHAFDEDPRLPWVEPFLGGALRPDPTLRINRLCRRAADHLDQAQGLGPLIVPGSHDPS